MPDTDPIWMRPAPRRVLLASDLSARCDRALDRAALIAARWQGPLTVLNVADAPQAPDLALAWAGGQDEGLVLQHAREQLRADVDAAGITAELRVVRGDAVDSICRVAAEEGSALVVTGMAHDEAFGRFLVGSTVEQLARRLAAPLLVVRNRPRAPYRNVLVATDLSDTSRDALEAAVRYVDAARFTLFHARSTPGLQPEDEVQAASRNQQLRDDELLPFLAGCNLPPGVPGRIHAVVEGGAVEAAVTRHVRANHVDLVVAGSHGRTGLLNVLLGSTAARLLDWLPCDTLLVRDPRAAR